jgi:hypothetical protein
MLSKSIGICAGLCFCIGGACGLPAIQAQETGAVSTPPPKVLQIDVESLKPGKSGSAHQKSESAFVNWMESAKWPQHYFAMDALTGPPRSLFFFAYDSFADFEKERQAENSSPQFAQLDSAFAADGELLTSLSENLYTYREDLSYNANVSIPTMRYMQISRITVKPGHQAEWEEYLKMLKDNLQKAEPDRHVAVFQSAYGWENGGVWLLITPMKSLTEVDTGDANAAKFREAMGDSNLKHYRELAGSAVQSSQRNLFAFNPGMSYVEDSWVAADPFWKHK